ncbi:FGGY-family carbohydrate kinase [Candidatus Caldatribacterium sp.]|uniref:FGGY-family carbohydrate kinase n=1 Tax=Candidatus Caldatribacterium sp. TaxID=2282143 RepID=UPI002995C0BB|nr:FGGY-family carbohydrate kinase [Candidatus Calescibacterium sp.]
METLVLGIDLGTQGVRAMIATLKGEVVAEEKEPIEFSLQEERRFEQDPMEWWEKTKRCITKALTLLDSLGYSRESLRALSVTSTSGTIIPVDTLGTPLMNALMYNDSRAQEEASFVNEVAHDFTKRLGYCFDPSFALCKVLWIRQNLPEVFDKTALFLHPTDYLLGHLTGHWGVSDISNTLKMGYDLMENRWPSFIEKLGIPSEKLPRVVVKSGEIVGTLRSSLAREWHLSPKLLVTAGATDGTAAFYASGAERPGDASSTLGTTLVVRSISERHIKDPRGRVYCHLHPKGFWLPGGASNTGGECLSHFFPKENLASWDEKVAQLPLPSPLLVYPLIRKGERFPFAHPHAEFFVVGERKTDLEFYAACLEGVGYVERYGFELLETLGATKIQRVFVSGSGSKSAIWRRIRANIANLPLYLPKFPDAAMGACIMAACPLFGDISQAIQSMVHIVAQEDPEKNLATRYEEQYHRFKEECQKRGYIRGQ